MTETDWLEWDRQRTAHQMASDGHCCPVPSSRFAESLARYAVEGLETGQFLRACLENDLAGAVSRADPDAFQELPTIMLYIYNTLPGDSWGSKEAVEKYLAEKREYLAMAGQEWMGVQPCQS